MGNITQRAQTFKGTAQRCAPGNSLPQRRLFPAVLPALNSLQWSRHGSLLPLLDPFPWEDETQGAHKNALSQQKPAISPIGLLMLRQHYYLLSPPVNRLLARLCQVYHCRSQPSVAVGQNSILTFSTGVCPNCFTKCTELITVFQSTLCYSTLPDANSALCPHRGGGYRADCPRAYPSGGSWEEGWSTNAGFPLQGTERGGGQPPAVPPVLQGRLGSAHKTSCPSPEDSEKNVGVYVL